MPYLGTATSTVRVEGPRVGTATGVSPGSIGNRALWTHARGSVSPVARRGPGGRGAGRASEPPVCTDCLTGGNWLRRTAPGRPVRRPASEESGALAARGRTGGRPAGWEETERALESAVNGRGSTAPRRTSDDAVLPERRLTRRQSRASPRPAAFPLSLIHISEP